MLGTVITYPAPIEGDHIIGPAGIFRNKAENQHTDPYENNDPENDEKDPHDRGQFIYRVTHLNLLPPMIRSFAILS